MVLVTYRTEAYLHAKAVGTEIKSTQCEATGPKTQPLHLQLCDLRVTYLPMYKALTHIL